MGEHAGHHWTVSRAGRLAAAAACALFIVLGFLLTFDGAAGSDRAAGVVMLVVAPVAAWALAWRPFVALGTDSVLVQNPLRRHEVPLGAIRGASGTYGGLSLDVRGRKRPVTAWAIQKMNLSTWRGRDNTRADLIAKKIMDAAYAPGLKATSVTD